jgi:hypothetical protein
MTDKEFSKLAAARMLGGYFIVKLLDDCDNVVNTSCPVKMESSDGGLTNVEDIHFQEFKHDGCVQYFSIQPVDNKFSIKGRLEKCRHYGKSDCATITKGNIRAKYE